MKFLNNSFQLTYPSEYGSIEINIYERKSKADIRKIIKGLLCEIRLQKNCISASNNNTHDDLKNINKITLIFLYEFILRRKT